MTNYDAWKTSAPREGAFTCACGELIREGEARCDSCDEAYRNECVGLHAPGKGDVWEDAMAAAEQGRDDWPSYLEKADIEDSLTALCVRHHELLESSKEKELQLMETIKSLREEMKRRDEIRPNLKAASPS